MRKQSIIYWRQRFHSSRESWIVFWATERAWDLRRTSLVLAACGANRVFNELMKQMTLADREEMNNMIRKQKTEEKVYRGRTTRQRQRTVMLRNAGEGGGRRDWNHFKYVWTVSTHVPSSSNPCVTGWARPLLPLCLLQEATELSSSCRWAARPLRTKWWRRQGSKPHPHQRDTTVWPRQLKKSAERWGSTGETSALATEWRPNTWQLWSHVITSNHLWSPVITCSRLWSPVITSSHLWSPVITSSQMWSPVITSSHLWSTVILLNYLSPLWSPVITYSHLWSPEITYSRLWSPQWSMITSNYQWSPVIITVSTRDHF